MRLELIMFIEENSKPNEKLKAWYLFTEDFVAGTQHLTNEQVGIYIRLLCFNWTKNTKPFQQKEAYRICQCRSKKCAGYIVRQGSRWRIKRQ